MLLIYSLVIARSRETMTSCVMWHASGFVKWTDYCSPFPWAPKWVLLDIVNNFSNAIGSMRLLPQRDVSETKRWIVIGWPLVICSQVRLAFVAHIIHLGRLNFLHWPTLLQKNQSEVRVYDWELVRNSFVWKCFAFVGLFWRRSRFSCN